MCVVVAMWSCYCFTFVPSIDKSPWHRALPEVRRPRQSLLSQRPPWPLLAARRPPHAAWPILQQYASLQPTDPPLTAMRTRRSGTSPGAAPLPPLVLSQPLRLKNLPLLHQSTPVRVSGCTWTEATCLLLLLRHRFDVHLQFLHRVRQRQGQGQGQWQKQRGSRGLSRESTASHHWI